MKRYFLLSALALATPAFAQNGPTTPVPPLPPAHLDAPAFAGPEVSAVMQPINAMLAGLSAGDAAAIRAQILPEGATTVALEKTGGIHTIRHMGWDQFLATVKPGAQKLQETLHDPAVEIDGDIAMVWARYTFTVDGKPAHCGYDHFDLVRQNGAWKVLNVTWSQRTTGCMMEER